MKHLNDENAKRTHLTEEEINSPEFNPHEFAPAPQKDTAKALGSNPRTTMIVAIVCAVFALLVAVIGVLLAKGTEEGAESIRVSTVASCYENCDEASFYKTVEGCQVYGVYFKERLAGFAVFCKTQGYGGEVETLVCFDADNKINRVKVISENESGRLGDQIKSAKFLKQFKGLSSDDANDFDVDLVSRATLSSNAVTDAVNIALDLKLSTFAIAKELGVPTISVEEIEEELNKETETTRKPSGSKVTDKVTEKPEDSDLDDFETGGNVNTGDDDIMVDTTDVTTLYETETNEGETTAQTTAAEETTKPPVIIAPVETTAPVADTTAPAETTAPADTTAPAVDTTAPAETTDAVNPTGDDIEA